MCPITQVRIKGQSKITDTKSVFEASQKDAMTDIVSKTALRSRRVRMEIEPESEAVRRSLKHEGECLSTMLWQSLF